MTGTLRRNGKDFYKKFAWSLVLAAALAASIGASLVRQARAARLEFAHRRKMQAKEKELSAAEQSQANVTGQSSASLRSFPRGWSEIPNSNLLAKCPDVAGIHGVEGCEGVIADWGGGLADTKRNRLVIWGGGHNGYFGNELYALDLNSLAMQRLTEPSSGEGLANLRSCPEAYSDGSPNARHTYSGLQYLPRQDLYFAFGAGLSPCGYFSNTVWTFDPVRMRWAMQHPKNHPNAAQNGSVPLTAYDSGTGVVYEVEVNTGLFWKYDISRDAWSSIGPVHACSKLNMTAAIDPIRKLYFCVGNSSFYKITLRGARTSSPRANGCTGLIAASAPGFEFDSSENLMVGWAGGDTVYIYDPDRDACTTQSYANGPGAPQKNGTYGRFRYFPALGIFALVNDAKQNGYTLRIN